MTSESMSAARNPRNWLAVAALFALPACPTANPGEPDAGFDTAACAQLHFRDTPSSTLHTSDPNDPACGNGENPPTGGLHYNAASTCRAFTTTVGRCRWLHNLEHGHIVLAYNCPSGCPDIVAALDALRREVPTGTNGVRRALLTPDSLLPKRVAAVAWGWSYSADEVDVDAIRCLLSKQDLHAPEPGIACGQ
jgi:hypothetical protein